MTDIPTLQERFTGCLLGGAVGDALGAPVEFMRRQQILERFGPEGISEYSPAFGGLGRITDDTQMTLFTAEGLLRARVRGAMHGTCSLTAIIASAYERWLFTQGGRMSNQTAHEWLNRGWLIGHHELHSRRAPGNTCLSSLMKMSDYGDLAINDSKGCGGVMRVAPVGLFGRTAEFAFALASDAAAITHGHPTGYFSAGALAVLVQRLVNGVALKTVCEELVYHEGHEETLAACRTNHSNMR